MRSDYKVETVSTRRPFEIQFWKIFICSVFIMLTEKFVLLFQNYKPIVKYGNVIYHFLVNILSVAAQLAASVAAAIFFYFCLEFANKKRDMEKYLNIRRILLFSIYHNMDTFSRIKNFESLGLINNYNADSVEAFAKLVNTEFTEYNSETLLQNV